jgi:hypothetical protein
MTGCVIFTLCLPEFAPSWGMQPYSPLAGQDGEGQECPLFNGHDVIGAISLLLSLWQSLDVDDLVDQSEVYACSKSLIDAKSRMMQPRRQAREANGKIYTPTHWG